MNKNKYKEPILIVSAPRCGSSLLGMILNKSGVWSGITKEPDEFNAKGYWENKRISKLLIKHLVKNDTTNIGKKFQPVNLEDEYFAFDRKILRVLKQEQYQINSEWFFKDPKIALTWKVWHKTFPNAKWIILKRKKDEVLKSYERTPFMDAYTTKAEWENYLKAFNENIKSIKKECSYIEFNIESLFENKEQDIQNLYDYIGITNVNAHIECIDKQLFGTEK